MCAPETTASKESSSKDSKAPTVVKNISTDVKMGLSTFGLTGKAQADKLKSQGYSDAAIKDYQDRTAANKARSAQIKTDDNDDKPAKVVTTTTDTDDTDTTTTTTDTTTERSTDISGAGTTRVKAKSIYTRDPEKALSDQEQLAAAELRRQREQRALSKAERLRTRLESAQKFGPQGRRGGSGRRSLMTGSRGGIGYYSRFK
jgi:secreted trypsin-like serine protease